MFLIQGEVGFRQILSQTNPNLNIALVVESQDNPACKTLLLELWGGASVV